MLSAAFQCYANQNRLIGFITSGKDDSVLFLAIDSSTEELVHSFVYEIGKIETFMAELSLLTNKFFKAIIVDLFGVNFILTSYTMNHIFCVKLKKKLQELKIPSYFITTENYLFSSLLIAAQVDASLDESILMILPFHEPKNKKNIFGLTVAEYKFTPNGYQLINHKKLESVNAKSKPEVLFQKICGSSNPNKIIVSEYGVKKIPFKKIFKGRNLTVFQCCLRCHRGKFLIETCKWLLDKSNVKYHIIPTCGHAIQISGYYGTEKNVLELVDIKMNDPLPISEEVPFERSVLEVRVLIEGQNATYGCKKDIRQDCHIYKCTVTIEEENLIEIDLTPLTLKNIEILPARIGKMLPFKIPIVIFHLNFSLICNFNKSVGKYEFLDKWNGKYGIDCFISFDEKKPKFGEDAQKMLKIKNTFVVFDLLKIMSMPSDDIKISKIWGFTFTKNAENPVLLEFDNFDGTKKAASPSFLMALFLRQHLKTIKAETGEKPMEIAFCVINKEEFSEDEMKRIHHGLEESCKLLKTGFHYINYDGIDFDQISID